MNVVKKTGSIYKIYNDSDPKVIYIGSTSGDIENRLKTHIREAKYKLHEKSKWFQYLRKHKFKGFHISLLSKIRYTKKSELRAAENIYITDLKPTLNSIDAKK